MPAAEEDGVIAEYDVLITPELQERMYLLQYLSRKRSDPYNEQNNSKPLEMRIKPKSGFMEVDIPLSTNANFDKVKGVVWGEALRSAKENGMASFGLASGFGKGAKGNDLLQSERVSHTKTGEEETQRLLRRFDESVDAGRVLNKLTLGGQIRKPVKGTPIYFMGVFRQNELHLTPIDGIAQLTAQFHHIDAIAFHNRAKAQGNKATAESAAEPRLVQQVARATGADGEELNVKDSSKFLTEASEEPWTRLKYYDEEADEAYVAYHEKLFVRDPDAVPQLASSMTNDQFLDSISAPRYDPVKKAKRKPLTRKQLVDLSKESGDDDDVEIQLPFKDGGDDKTEVG
ncbi:hypothetical protein EJ06DRAFT_533800 [Trichodelitschia bisporula]|uniref:Uncharacterized protein n=1 Tax=Trichodelitschia bisporula TaxID=703511 RepID=A0A6G1HKF7_9PEZI|nr:hypothetical protein EJ06DRAFT_533800 [Trichodelitschia bisporula]